METEQEFARRLPTIVEADVRREAAPEDSHRLRTASASIARQWVSLIDTLLSDVKEQIKARPEEMVPVDQWQPHIVWKKRVLRFQRTLHERRVEATECLRILSGIDAQADSLLEAAAVMIEDQPWHARYTTYKVARFGHGLK